MRENFIQKYIVREVGTTVLLLLLCKSSWCGKDEMNAVGGGGSEWMNECM